MSILDAVLKEEYERCERIKQMHLEKLQGLPEGYLSRKNIKGKVYYYLQRREDGKVVSRYVPSEDVEILQKLIGERRRVQNQIKLCEADQKKIRKAVGSVVIR